MVEFVSTHVEQKLLDNLSGYWQRIVRHIRDKRIGCGQREADSILKVWIEEESYIPSTKSSKINMQLNRHKR